MVFFKNFSLGNFGFKYERCLFLKIFLGNFFSWIFIYVSTHNKYNLNILVEYALSIGFKEVSLIHRGISRVNWVTGTVNEPNTIRIEFLKNIEHQVFLMLHELGHHELRKDWVKFRERFPILAKASERAVLGKRYGYLYKNKSYNLSCLEEEFMAWELGLELSKRLGITINPKRWERYRLECLSGYVRYYALRV